MTFPTIMESTASLGTFPASRAALEAISWRSMAENGVSLPPYAPNGVRLAATMYTFFTATNKKNNQHINGSSTGI